MLQKIFLKDFRNFESIVLDFSPTVNIFVGENGQGKSNLLEAILILSTGDSFRHTENENLIRHSCSQAYLKAKAISQNLDFEVEAAILKSKKNHLLNKKKVTVTELFKKFPCVTFSPESLSAIKDASDQRRQLVDELIVSVNPQNAGLISDYRKALKTRNRILKDNLAGDIPRNTTVDLLESINPTFLRLATDLTYQRTQALERLLSEFNKAMKMISRKDNVDISVEYVISDQSSLQKSSEELNDMMRKRMIQLHDAELSSGVSLVGPHKHDLTFLYGGNDSRFYCSQGQQRALILSFKIAQIVYHRQVHETYPMLMLDDVLSELDAEKRDSLIRFVSGVNTQVFMTTTDFTLPESMKSEDCAVIRIRDGLIGP